MRRWGLPNQVADDSEILKKISRAISNNETVLEIGEDNSGKLVSSIDRVIDRKSSFAVKPKPLMFVMDFDEADDLLKFEDYVVAIKKMGYDPVVTESGSPGHRHLICNSISAKGYSELFRTAELYSIEESVRRNFIRPPGSPHRKGLPVRIVSHETASDALRALGSTQIDLRLPDSLNRKIVKAEGVGIIYKSHSELTQSIVNQCYSLGMSVDEIYNLLRDSSNSGGRALQKRIKSKGSKSAIKWLSLSFDKAREYSIRVNPEAERLDLIEQIVIAMQWKGKSGLTDRDVILAHVAISRKAKSNKYKASLRAVANLANLGSLMTVRKSQGRLESAGFLRRIGESKKGIPTSWEIICNSNDTYKHIGGCDTNVSFARHSSSEVFAWSLSGVKGLGKSGIPLLDALASEGPLGVSTAAKKTGLARQTIYRASRRLERLGLVEITRRVISLRESRVDELLKKYCKDSGLSVAKYRLKERRKEESLANRARLFQKYNNSKNSAKQKVEM